jgi:hypothetical protein
LRCHDGNLFNVRQKRCPGSRGNACDSEYCSARQNIQTQLKQHNFRLDSQHGGELPQALPAQILGMAFEDFEHNRGSTQVATVWELHPAIVTLQ